jgi:hypothetical protein
MAPPRVCASAQRSRLPPEPFPKHQIVPLQVAKPPESFQIALANLSPPPSTPERQAAALAKYLDNMAQSRLYRLPTELALIVVGSLDGADLMSLEASCHHFRYMLKQETKQLDSSNPSAASSRDEAMPYLIRPIDELELILSPASRREISLICLSPREKRILLRSLADARYEMVKRLRKDDFVMLAALEDYSRINNPTHSRIQKLLCSFCHTSHCVSKFGKDALHEPALTRVCRGAKGTFRVCEHQAFNFTDLQKSTVRNHCSPNSFHGRCRHTHATGNPVVHHLAVDSSFVDYWREEEEWYVLQLSLNIVPKHCKGMYIEDIPALLVELDVYICPHFRSSYDTVFRQLVRRIEKKIQMEEQR